MISGSPAADPADPGAADFAGRFEDEFDSPAPPFALEAYEGAVMILEAVEEVQEDPREITRFLQLNRRFRGDAKPYEYDDRGELVNAPVWVYESTNGGWKLSGRSDRVAAR